MLNKKMGTKLLMSGFDESRQVKLYTKSYGLLLNFRKVQQTGMLFGGKVYNEIFVKLKSHYYTPVTQFLTSATLIESLFQHHKRIEKLLNYYTQEYYKEIEKIIIVGEDPYMALPHALALWVDYNLLKPYYNGAQLNKIDQTFWAHHINNILNKVGQPIDKPLLKSRRFNLFAFLDLITHPKVPLIYRDGLLLVERHKMFTNYDIFDRPTVKRFINIFIKILSNPSLAEQNPSTKHFYELFWNPRIVMFPYTFFTSLTDYGYVVNLYKFNMETFNHDLILAKPVHSNALLKALAVGGYEFEGVVSETFDDSHEVLNSIKKEWFTRHHLSHIGFDDEYLYLTKLKIDNRPKKCKINVFKIPLNKIDSIEMRNYLLKIEQGGKQTTLFTMYSDINTKIKIK